MYKKLQQRRNDMREFHGMTDTSEYNTWRQMKQRCNNEGSQSYDNYGARGISVCPEWSDSFLQFYNDMGARPEGMSLDRIDNDGNYDSNNCKWSTDTEQNLNKRYPEGALPKHLATGKGGNYYIQVQRDNEMKHYGTYDTIDKAIVARDTLLEYIL